MNTAMNTKKRRPGKPAPRSNSTQKSTQKAWKSISFASDCGTDDDGQPLEECSLCGDSYADCECPGPTQDDYEYTTIKGILYARPA